MWTGNQYNSPGGYSNSFHSRYGSQVTGGMSPQWSPKQDEWYNNANENQNKKMSAFSPAGRPLSRSKGNEFMQQANMGVYDRTPIAHAAAVVSRRRAPSTSRRPEWPGIEPGSNPPVTKDWTPNVVGRPTKWKNCPPEIEANEAAAKKRYRRDKQANWIRTRRAQPGYVSPRPRTGNPRGRPKLPDHLKAMRRMKGKAIKLKSKGNKPAAGNNSFSPLALGRKTPSVRSKTSKNPMSPKGWS